jgi:hypothetical protein
VLVRRGAKTPRTFGKINLCVAALGAEPFLGGLVSDSAAHHYDTPDPAQPGIRQKSEESKGAVFSRQNIAPNRERRIHERRQSIWSGYMHNRHVDVEERTVTFQFRGKATLTHAIANRFGDQCRTENSSLKRLMTNRRWEIQLASVSRSRSMQSEEGQLPISGEEKEDKRNTRRVSLFRELIDQTDVLRPNRRGKLKAI